MDVACPQCGNPNLDVDAQNSVVYCKKCGFAVRVDPQTGETTPLSPGGQAGGEAPPAQGGSESTATYSDHSILEMDAFMFWMVGTAALLFLTLFTVIPDLTWFVVLEVMLTVFWWMKR